ncbi:uncharacterized protein LOC133461386 [Cololabis saira]|uniref:uncharacterized protein LOC133461386 n=1 Tax=Cololabis saira TaxID=129043 RepID=UPI002AD2108F|nr:uncharacterized protein LOC133461386 [Cololabis saira]
MSALRSGSSLRTLVLTPERIPSFFIPPRSPRPRSPRLVSPRLLRSSPDRYRLLSDPDEEDGPGPGATSATSASRPEASTRFFLAAPRLGHSHQHQHRPAAADDAELNSVKAKSHEPKGKMPRRLRGVLSKNLLHHNKAVKVTVTDADTPEPESSPAPGLGPERSRGPESSPPGPGRSLDALRPVKAFGLQVKKELRKPAAALKSLSAARRVTGPR